MVDEILKAINLNDLTVMGGFVLITWLITRVVLVLGSGWMQNSRESLVVSRATNTILTQLDRKIDDDQRVTTSLIETVQTLTSIVRDLKGDISAGVSTMQGVSAERIKKLDIMHTDIKTVPDEVWRLGDPKIGAIQEIIERHFKTLETRLIEHLDPSAVNARIAVKTEFEVIRAQFAQSCEQVTARLLDIEHALKSINAKHEPGEGADPAVKQEQI